VRLSTKADSATTATPSYLLLGHITEANSSGAAIPSTHTYKAISENGAIEITVAAAPANSMCRSATVATIPAAVNDKCWLGEWGGAKFFVAYEKPGAELPATPGGDGTYIHTVTVTGGAGTTSWEPPPADELPSVSGESQYMVLQLNGATPKAPIWGWVRAHG